jgi:hypothetical protein
MIHNEVAEKKICWSCDGYLRPYSYSAQPDSATSSHLPLSIDTCAKSPADHHHGYRLRARFTAVTIYPWLSALALPTSIAGKT